MYERAGNLYGLVRSRVTGSDGCFLQCFPCCSGSIQWMCIFCAMMGNWTSAFLKKKNIYSAGGTIPVLETIVLITVLSTKFVGYLYEPRLELLVI